MNTAAGPHSLAPLLGIRYPHIYNAIAVVV